MNTSKKKLLETPALSTQERYDILNKRDNLLRTTNKKQVCLKSSKKNIGTCPDMCPEKERFQRELEHQISIFEEGDISGKINHQIAIKQYIRSSADQVEPLSHELRPTPVLQMTMNYILNNILDNSEKNIAEWYHFIWNRTRAIRKDITQQELCNRKAVALIEQCARFHIYCSERLIEEDKSIYDDKINTENLTKCLQSLKYMYSDLAKKGIQCQNESEFRAYMIYLNLNNGNCLVDLEKLNISIRNSSHMILAKNIFLSLNTNNYVKFFHLVKNAPYLVICILRRYFLQIRYKAFLIIIKAYTIIKNNIKLPMNFLNSVLGFINNNQQEAQEFYQHLNLKISNNNNIILSKSFTMPTTLYLQKRAWGFIQTTPQSIKSIIAGENTNDSLLYKEHNCHTSFNSEGVLNNNAFDANDQEEKLAFFNTIEMNKISKISPPVFINPIQTSLPIRMDSPKKKTKSIKRTHLDVANLQQIVPASVIEPPKKVRSIEPPRKVRSIEPPRKVRSIESPKKVRSIELNQSKDSITNLEIKKNISLPQIDPPIKTKSIKQTQKNEQNIEKKNIVKKQPTKKHIKETQNKKQINMEVITLNEYEILTNEVLNEMLYETIGNIIEEEIIIDKKHQENILYINEIRKKLQLEKLRIYINKWKRFVKIKREKRRDEDFHAWIGMNRPNRDINNVNHDSKSGILSRQHLITMKQPAESPHPIINIKELLYEIIKKQLIHQQQQMLLPKSIEWCITIINLPDNYQHYLNRFNFMFSSSGPNKSNLLTSEHLSFGKLNMTINIEMSEKNPTNNNFILIYNTNLETLDDFLKRFNQIDIINNSNHILIVFLIFGKKLITEESFISLLKLNTYKNLTFYINYYGQDILYKTFYNAICNGLCFLAKNYTLTKCLQNLPLNEFLYQFFYQILDEIFNFDIVFNNDINFYIKIYNSLLDQLIENLQSMNFFYIRFEQYNEFLNNVNSNSESDLLLNNCKNAKLNLFSNWSIDGTFNELKNCLHRYCIESNSNTFNNILQVIYKHLENNDMDLTTLSIKSILYLLVNEKIHHIISNSQLSSPTIVIYQNDYLKKLMKNFLRTQMILFYNSSKNILLLKDNTNVVSNDIKEPNDDCLTLEEIYHLYEKFK